MFGHFALGTRVRPAADVADEEPHLPPKQRPSERSSELDLSPTLAEPSDAAPCPGDYPSTPPQPIDNLVDELSKQTLFPDIPRRRHTRTLSSSSSIVAHLSSVALEVDNDCQMDLSMDDVKGHQPVADWKRSRRQWHGRYANNAPAMEARLRDMISDKSQCHVTPAPTSSSTRSAPTYPVLPNIEVDSRRNVEPSFDLESDEGFGEENDQLIQEILCSSVTQPISSVSGGLRQYGALRFRGSAETALRCRNVVRQRPRMRKRKGPGPSHEPRPT